MFCFIVRTSQTSLFRLAREPTVAAEGKKKVHVKLRLAQNV